MRWIIGCVTLSMCLTIVLCCQNETITTCPKENLTCAMPICWCSSKGPPAFYYTYVNCINVLEDIPADIPKEVRFITMTGNNLTTIKAGAFTSLHSLMLLTLSENNIENIEPGAFVDLPWIASIALPRNKLTKLTTGIFRNIPVYMIDLTDNNITTIEKYAYDNLTGVSYIQLENGHIIDIESKAFNNMPSLTSIRLSGNKITEVRTAVFKDIPVKTIDLQNNNINTIETHAFDNLENLIEIHLQNNSITYIESEAFHNLPKLELINLDSNKIHTLRKDSFKDLPVKNLYFSDSRISVIESHTFNNLQNITELILHNNPISLIERDAFLNVRADKLELGINKDFVMEENTQNTFASINFTGNYLTCNCSFMWFVLWLKANPVTQVNGFCPTVNKTVGKLLTDDYKLCYEDSVKKMICNISHKIEIRCTYRWITSYFKHWVHKQNGSEIRKLTGQSIDNDTNVLSIAFCNYEDVGDYTCIRTTNYSALAEVASVTIELSVHAAPILLNQHSVEVGNDLVLSVVFLCDPYTEPDWLLGDTVLSKGSAYMMSISPYSVYLKQPLSRTYEGFITNLTIFNYKQLPSAPYTCRINNGFGEVSKTMISRSVDIEMPRTITFETSTTAEIKCTLYYFGAIPDLWIHSSGGQVIRSLRGTVVNYTNILLIPFCNYQDMGDYTCTWRTTGPALLFTKTSSLVVNGPPLLIEQIISRDGNETVLSVYFFSQPFPVEPKWYFHGTLVLLCYDYQQTSTYSNVTVRQHRRDIIRQGFVSNLTIVNSKPELHGGYTCQIVNDFGNLHLEFEVNEALKNNDAKSPSIISTTIIVSTSVSGILVLITVITVVVCKCRKPKEDGYTDAAIPQRSVQAVYDSFLLSRLPNNSDACIDVY